MRVCLHTIWDIKHDFIGGTERFLVDLGKELQALGYRPVIACTGLADRTRVEGIEVVSLVPQRYLNKFEIYGGDTKSFLKSEVFSRKNKFDALNFLSEFVAEQLSNIEADVFHINSFVSASFLNLAKPCVVTNHENDLEYDNIWGQGFFSNFAKLVSSKSTCLHSNKVLIAPSIHYSDRFAREFDVPVTPVKQGISLNNFMINSNYTSDRYDDSSEITLLLPSRFEPRQKGHDTAALACQILKQEGMNVRMIFTGIREDYLNAVTDFRSDLDRYGIKDRITFKRYDRIQHAYEQCDVVVSPERYCSYGLSISEALSLGIPTVLSDIPTYREIASGFEHAFFFPCDEANSMAREVQSAVQHIGRIPTSEVIRFRTQNDLRNCAKEYSNLYQTLI